METARMIAEIVFGLVVFLALVGAAIAPCILSGRISRQEEKDELWLADHIHETTATAGRRIKH